MKWIVGVKGWIYRVLGGQQEADSNGIYMPIRDRIFLAYARTEIIFHEGLADQKFGVKEKC